MIVVLPRLHLKPLPSEVSDGDLKNPWGLQRSSFQALCCCVAMGSFFSVMGAVLLLRRLNIQNPSGLHDL